MASSSEARLKQAYEADEIANNARRQARAIAFASFAAIGYYGLALGRGDPPEDTVVPKAGAVLIMAPLALNLSAMSVRDGSKKYARRIAAGLLLCACGDACLELENSESFEDIKGLLFLGGLGSFLVGHVLYIAAFAVNRFKIRLLVSTPLLLYVLGIFLVLYDSLPSGLIAPVGLYASTIGWMAVMACSRQPAGVAHSTWSKCTAVAGALLFAASDTVLAINKFVKPIPQAKGVVMATYFGAQALIAASVRGAGGRAKAKKSQ